MLDRKRHYGEVYGEGVAGARWYQDGNYFAPGGEYLFSNSDATPPAGETKRTMEEAEADHQLLQQAMERGERPTPKAKPAVVAAARKTVATAPPAPGTLVQPAAPAVTQAEGLSREQKLTQLGHFELANLVKTAGGTPITGKGSKAKNIAWLLANTSE